MTCKTIGKAFRIRVDQDMFFIGWKEVRGHPLIESETMQDTRQGKTIQALICLSIQGLHLLPKTLGLLFMLFLDFYEDFQNATGC
jgi:hypothetical protein